MADTILVRNSYSANNAKAVVYSPDGRPVTTSRANARDLVGQCNYTWNPPERNKDEADATEEAPAVEVAAEVSRVESLEEMAKRVYGEADVEAFLKAYTVKNLHDLVEERYAMKLDKRLNKENLITEIIKLEDERLDKIPAWFMEAKESDDSEAYQEEGDSEEVTEESEE